MKRKGKIEQMSKIDFVEFLADLRAKRFDSFAPLLLIAASDADLLEAIFEEFSAGDEK